MAGKTILMLTGEFSEEYEIFVFQKAFDTIDAKYFAGGAR